MAVERKDVGTSTKSHDIESTPEHRHKVEKARQALPTIHGTGPDVMIAKLALLPPRRRSRDPRTHPLKLRPSGHNGSSNQTLLDRARLVRSPTYVLPQKPKRMPQQLAVADHGQTKQGEGRKVSIAGSQSFKIYTEETSLKSRPSTVALNVPDKAKRTGDPTFGNGTYVPKNAALGLAKTTTLDADERGRLSRQLSQKRLLVVKEQAIEQSLRTGRE